MTKQNCNSNKRVEFCAYIFTIPIVSIIISGFGTVNNSESLLETLFEIFITTPLMALLKGVIPAIITCYIANILRKKITNYPLYLFIVSFIGGMIWALLYWLVSEIFLVTGCKSILIVMVMFAVGFVCSLLANLFLHFYYKKIEE